MNIENGGSTGRRSWYGPVFVALVLLLGVASTGFAVRLKDMIDLQGVRENQLIGYGLVVGLDGTGDGNKAQFTTQALSNMLEKLGVSVNAEDLKVKNVAAVVVTTNLPPFGRAGSRIDALVSSIGDAANLQGGTLLMTPLKAADGKVYAVAQGPISTGGFSAGGEAGGGVQKNFPTVGRVVEGALIERELTGVFAQRDRLSLALRQPDFTTAHRIAQAINLKVPGAAARTLDAGTLEVQVPDSHRKAVVAFVAMLENLDVTPDTLAKVVINERTGTVVMGADVRLATVAIAHGNLSIEIKERTQVSQPLPFSEGDTVVSPDSKVVVTEGNSRLFVVEKGVSIGEVVSALNALGVSPRDLIAIFQAIKVAGALKADLEII